LVMLQGASSTRTTAQGQDDVENNNAQVLPLSDYPPVATRAENPAIKYWTKAEYNRARRRERGNTNALATARPRRGRPRRESESDAEDATSAWDSLDPNKVLKHPYIEKADGTPAGRETLFAIGFKVRRIWQTLAAKGIAPMTWSLITDSAYEYFNREMLNAFTEFRLCDNNWKLHHWVTRNYASWHQNHLKEKASTSGSGATASTSASSAGTTASTSASGSGATASTSGFNGSSAGAMASTSASGSGTMASTSASGSGATASTSSSNGSSAGEMASTTASSAGAMASTSASVSGVTNLGSITHTWRNPR
jgi:hypothetical protein